MESFHGNVGFGFPPGMNMQAPGTNALPSGGLTEAMLQEKSRK